MAKQQRQHEERQLQYHQQQQQQSGVGNTDDSGRSGGGGGDRDGQIAGWRSQSPGDHNGTVPRRLSSTGDGNQGREGAGGLCSLDNSNNNNDNGSDNRNYIKNIIVNVDGNHTSNIPSMATAAVTMTATSSVPLSTGASAMMGPSTAGLAEVRMTQAFAPWHTGTPAVTTETTVATPVPADSRLAGVASSEGLNEREVPGGSDGWRSDRCKSEDGSPAPKVKLAPDPWGLVGGGGGGSDYVGRVGEVASAAEVR